jgi:hypothetical protein
MRETKFDPTGTFPGGNPVPVKQPATVPEPIAVKLAELYTEYVKPERFYEWVYEQEHLKRELAKQQQQLELQRQHVIARAEIFGLSAGWDSNQFIRGVGWDRDCDKQQQR